MKALESNFNSFYENCFGNSLLLEMNKKDCTRKEEYVLPIANAFANGYIKFIPSGSDKWYAEISLQCFSDIKLPLWKRETDLIYFIYCSTGQVLHKAKDQEAVIDEYQTAIIIDPNDTDLTIKAGEMVKLSIISIEKTEQANEGISSEIHRIFEEKLENKSFLYYGSSNLQIADQISKLSNTTKKGVVKKLFVEGVIQLILAMEIQHHHKDVSTDNVLIGLLTLREQKIIKNIAQEIQNNCDYPFSIKYLIQKTGLSAAKLQEGFKLLYDRTVTDYIKNVRIEKAEDLIKTTDLNISEIVYAIGFTSRSYFSKIFKEKYNCSPRYYQEKSRIYSLANTA